MVLTRNINRLINSKTKIMKKLFFVFAIASLFAACKSKSTTDLETNKSLLLLTDSLRMNNSSYLTDTGAVSAAAIRNGNMSGAATNTNVTRRTTGTTRTNTNKPSRTYGNTRSTSSGNGSTATTTTRKRGWSKAAKGATIGAVGGAVAGAVIGHNAKGAVIGAVIGGAGGYIIGRNKDKKDGRVHQ